MGADPVALSHDAWSPMADRAITAWEAVALDAEVFPGEVNAIDDDTETVQRCLR